MSITTYTQLATELGPALEVLQQQLLHVSDAVRTSQFLDIWPQAMLTFRRVEQTSNCFSKKTFKGH